MNKCQLIAKVSQEVDLTKAHTERVVGAFLSSIKDGLADGDTIKLMGFGSFKAKFRKGRIGRNPRTGEEIAIPDKVVVKFKPGKELKELVG